MFSPSISEVLQVLSSDSLCRHNTWVHGLEWLWLHESVLICGHELSLVVSASITDHNLRRILIWHHNSWLRESTSEGIWVIWLQWLLNHACV